jgi:hypothetical protein
VPESRLPEELTSPIRKAICAALEATYLECQRRFDRSVGFDGQTFGQMVYKSSWFHLEQTLHGMAGVRTLRDSNSFEIAIGRVLLHPYKVGHQEGDIETRRPSNEAVLEFMARTNQEQLELIPSLAPTRLILAHAGNPIDALRAVYIAAPIPSGSGDVEWAYSARIDEISARDIDAEPVPVPIELPRLTVIRESPQTAEPKRDA